MRKFFLGAALVAASFGMAQSADAATVMDVDGVSTVLAISDYEGTYNGTMDQIKMRGEDYEPLLKPTCGTHQRQTLPSEKACL